MVMFPSVFGYVYQRVIHLHLHPLPSLRPLRRFRVGDSFFGQVSGRAHAEAGAWDALREQGASKAQGAVWEGVLGGSMVVSIC